ncbi:5252_t:CDS:2, partial [Entrophospora sp. SA101]
EAYDLLTDKDNPSGPDGGQPRMEKCSYCEKEYDFDREKYKEHKKDEKENIPETQQDEYPDHRNGGKGTEKDDLDNNSKSGSDDNSNNIPNQRGENNNELPPDIQEIANLSLPQAKQKAEQEIEKLLKDNAISGQQLDTKNFGESNN